MTLQVQVADVAAARRFYTALLGADPEFEPHDDFLEWRVGDGETWVQVVGMTGAVRPLRNRVRFRIEDVAAARALAQASGWPVSEVMTLAGVVRWVDLTDPWGNELGWFGDLAPTGGNPGPGGTVHDDAHVS